MQKYTGFLVAALLFISCSPDRSEELDLLEGTWTRTFNNTIQSEVWNKRNDTLVGVATFTTNDVTTISETMKIYQQGSEWYFEADVPENVSPTQFKLSKESGNGLVFENPEHDFPQFIRYQVKTDSLYTAIGGRVNGFDKTAVFDFKRSE